MQNIKQAIALRETVGYPRFMHDEEWHYRTKQDDRVCPICKPLDGHVYRGDYIPDLFPHNDVVTDVIIEINLHLRCRCRGLWQNKRDVLVQRLHEELMAVAAG
jgi:hypothetical protein